MPTSSSSLALMAYTGDGAVLLAFSLDPDELKAHELVGFSIECTPPAGKPYFLENRLNYHRCKQDRADVKGESANYRSIGRSLHVS
jgi:hypothetical protein